MTANTVVNQKVFHFFEISDIPIICVNLGYLHLFKHENQYKYAFQLCFLAAKTSNNITSQVFIISQSADTQYREMEGRVKIKS